MSGISTLLADRVESLLPRGAAAACIYPQVYCSSHCDNISGSCLWLYRYCRLSCHGKFEGCGSWYVGRCS